MTKKERQSYILRKVEKEGKLLTNDMISELEVAEDTIRKDFQELVSEGLVKRFHGGIISLKSGKLDTDSNKIEFDKRASLYSKQKELLAKECINLIQDKKVLFIDSGSTNLKFAESLKDFTGTIITNSPLNAVACCMLDGAKITLLSGELDKKSKVIKGSSTIKQISQLNIECCILGVSSLSHSVGITVPSYDESILKKELIDQSNIVIAIATKEKLETIATYYVDDITSLTHLITDETDEDILNGYRNKGIDVLSIEI